VHPQLAHKDADFDMGQGGMMHDAPNLLGFGQHVLQIAPQPGWVLAIPVGVGRRPVQNRLDSLPQHLRCLRLGQPKRFEHAQHQPSVNLRDRQFSELRIGVALQRAEPVLTVRGFSMPGYDRRTGLDALFEGLVPRRFQGTLGFFRPRRGLPSVIAAFRLRGKRVFELSCRKGVLFWHALPTHSGAFRRI
jgi:hypothetical protein